MIVNSESDPNIFVNAAEIAEPAIFIVVPNPTLTPAPLSDESDCKFLVALYMLSDDVFASE